MKRAPGVYWLPLMCLLLWVTGAWGGNAGAATPVPYALADGTRLEGFLSLPPQYQKGERYPAVLLLHGGRGDDGV